MGRVFGTPPPWTRDRIIAEYRFTNAFRASDRVSQQLIRIAYSGEQSADEVCFRVLLFKSFNRIGTWEAIAREGVPRWESFDSDKCGRVLDEMMRVGEPVYSNAYIMPPPSLGHERKHRNHLELISMMMRDGVARRVADAGSLRTVFEILSSYPSLGDFLAFQIAIDLNYTSLVNFSEMDFVVAGPGARDGISKCFSDTAGLSEAEIIGVVAERQDEEFKVRGINFQNLWGRRLQLVDCQNLFCETDKYARIAHPDFPGRSSRTRIKQRFAANLTPLPQWYPPKWRLEVPVGTGVTSPLPESQNACNSQLTLGL